MISDASHAFGLQINAQPIVNFGDLLMLSFYATKVFNTIEGGALITDNPKLKQRIDYLKNFGFAGETSVVLPGTNGKINELQAAYGLLQLKYIDEEIAKCLQIADAYRDKLLGVRGIRLIEVPADVSSNHGYFPIFVDKAIYGTSRDDLYERLKTQGIFGRRYFYPLISNFADYRNLPSAAAEGLSIANTAAQQVICLPMFADLTMDVVKSIAESIRRLARNKQTEALPKISL